MRKFELIERIAAATIAAIAWAGLVVQLIASSHQNSSVLLSLWTVLAYYTITSNLLVAIVFSGIALTRSAFRLNGMIAGTMLAILLVGVVYVLLLHGTMELSGHSAVANVLLHMVTPILVPLFWIAFTKKGSLTWRHPFLWAIYPLVYLAYGMARGAATGLYAYPFLNVLMLGWERTTLNALAIALAFMLSGFLVVWIDGRMGSRADAAGECIEQR